MSRRDPEPASRRERALTVAAFALLVLARLLTLARDPWEWDEVLFGEAARSGLDVRLNHPHPPGYPGFVYPARLLVELGASPFAATTGVAFVGGILSLLGLFALLSAFGSARRFAALGAIAFGLVPSVWLHSVRPLSDAPGIAAFLFAAAYLVRAVREGSGRALVFAALLTAIVGAVRPHGVVALLPAALAAAVAVWRKERRFAPLALAVGAGIAVTLAFWIPAIHASGGWGAYRDAFDRQVAYVALHERPTAEVVLRSSFWKRWWYDPFGGADAAFAFLAAGLLALFLVPRRAFGALGLFLPAVALTMLGLGRVAAPRYALAFLPLPALLLAFTAERLAATRFGGRAVFPAAALLLAWMVFPALPAIAEVHGVPSPSYAVIDALRAPRFAGRPLAVHDGLTAHGNAFLAGRRWRPYDAARPVPLRDEELLVWIDDEPAPRERAIFTARYRNVEMLARIARGRYLTSAIYER